MEISDIINHLGENREEYYNSVSPPIMQSSNFCFKTVDKMRQCLQKEFEHPFYSRGYNPTVGILRKKLAALEHTEDSLVFASGSAAIAAAVMNEVQQGDHVVCIKSPYSWTNYLLNTLLAKYGVTTAMIDGTKVENFEAAIQENTKLIFLETPNSMTFELQDLEAVTKLAKSKNITTVCDNSYSTPLCQNPADYGIDIIVHSASKYLSGHSDLVAGVLCASKKRVENIMANEFMTLGGIIGPFEAWLILRGLRTLPVRLKTVLENSMKVLEFLENHPKIEKVIFPFSKKNPQYELAKKQMKPCGGLMTIYLKTDDIKKVETFSNSLNYFLLACSWGGYESLQFPIATLHDSKSYHKTPHPANMIRLYVGLEDPSLLINDLSQALEKI